MSFRPWSRDQLESDPLGSHGVLTCRDILIAESKADEHPSHAYPSSSRKQHNWDAIVKKSAEEDEELAKEFSKNPNSGDKAVNELFQKLYADASDEQRRAMIKSYQESNGTALSMDWKDVSKVRNKDPSVSSCPFR